ncbi:MAG: TIGR00300 family protein [Verrucomicrobia bacterium]|jgi:lysine-ketoglutarate reductase/saccharopine dehydrogenase-like protein (TIGR00300 family)|nr:MAG: TIGR00300 family protein [Verrucomicrobiota bacterium]
MFSETIELRGHIIDSLILPKVLDQILTHGANFKITEINIGQKRADQSFARIEVSAETGEALDELILRLRQQGAEVVERANAQVARAPVDGVFPRDFYVTTNQQTFVRLEGKEIEVRPAMVNSAIALDRKRGTARAVKFFDVNKGDEIVIGHQGVRVVPVQRATTYTDLFQFINTTVDADEPKSAIIRGIGDELRRARGAKGKIAIVAGPAIVRTGAGQHLVRLIEAGYVDRLFAGNLFAAYDVERALFGTSLGTNPDLAVARGGHENHLRAINTIREAGGVSAAVQQKILTGGILHACVRHDVDIVLTGGIRDEGPIPGVTTDVIEAQKVMRTKLADVTHVILLATVQHSLAVASMLAPDVKTVCVDIDPPAVERAIEHQPLQSIGLVTDVEPFLRELAGCLTESRVRD